MAKVVVNIVWREMSYRLLDEKLSIEQRLQVEPEELSEYTEEQFRKDVANEPYEPNLFVFGGDRFVL